MTGRQSITPERARDLYLESIRDDAAEWTQTGHRSHLRPWVEWCREEGGIDDLTDLDGRDLFEYRIWRRDGGYSDGQDETLAPKTLDSALTTLRAHLRFCADIEAVPEDLYEKVPLVSLSKSDEVSDSFMDPERVPGVVDYLGRYKHGSRDHVLWSLVWGTGMRLGGVRALDLADCDLDDEKPGLDLRHRPDTGTPLKNDFDGERFVRIGRGLANVLMDWIDGPRPAVQDDHGRVPLVTTRFGRASAHCIRDAFYRWSRPCHIGLECPHDEDPDTCPAASGGPMSRCPSARSPHDVRKARVTQYRDDDVPRGVVSDRLDASEDVLDKHYDRASRREKAERRWRHVR